MRPRSHAFAFLVASVLASLAVPTTAEAGGAVVPLAGRSDPSTLDVRVAVAVSPNGSTRWSEITVPDSTRVLWLVPARPGAMIAWASDNWLPSLEDATAPRVLPPSFGTTCNLPQNAERSSPWTTPALKRQPATFDIHPTADSVRNAATAKGYAVSASLDARIAALYADGWNLVALEMESKLGSASSGTLRISDDGGAALPLALAGTRGSDTRVTGYAIGAGYADIDGARGISGNALRWGTSGSNFLAWRRDVLEAGSGDVWLREASSHDALFYGTTINGGIGAPSVVSSYLVGTSCASTAKSASSSNDIVGDSLPASTFGCSGLDDLAIALDGLAPRTAMVTRWTGLVPRGVIASDRTLTFFPTGADTQPVVRAGAYDSCITGNSAAPQQPLAPGPSEVTTEEHTEATTDVVYVSDGCGGGTETTTTYEDDETTTTSTSEDDCGGDSSTTSSSGDGWDSSDSSDSGDSCGSDSESSSSSSDSCGGGSSSSSSGKSDDGWDTDDDSMSPKNKKTSMKLRSKRSKSPVSRIALFAFAIILPLRRRARAALQKR